jgi:hypothetical protein
MISEPQSHPSFLSQTPRRMDIIQSLNTCNEDKYTFECQTNENIHVHVLRVNKSISVNSETRLIVE